MRFSIRTLLALTLLIALMLLTARRWNAAQVKKISLLQTTQRIEQLKLAIASSKRVKQKMADTEAEVQSTKAIADKAVKGLKRMQQRQSVFKNHDGNVPGDRVFSVRPIPTISQNGNPTARFRFLVPTGRPVWVCLGVAPEPVDQNAFYDQDDPVKLVSESPFTHTGPYEFRLTPGEHELRVVVTKRGPPSMRLEIDEDIQFESSYIAESNPWIGFATLNEQGQQDFPADRKPPWLLVGEVQVFADSSRSSSKHLEAMNVWLDDRSRGFKPFPGAE